MPAKRKTTPATAVAVRRLFDKRNEQTTWPPFGMERTRGYTVHRLLPARIGSGGGEFVNREPPVWVLRKRMRVRGTTGSEETDPLVVALWDTLPKNERRRSRLFVHCDKCPVRFTKKGAIADALRCGRVARYSPPTEHEREVAAARLRAEAPTLDPRDDYERAVAEVWDDLSQAHRRTLYAAMRPTAEREAERSGVPWRLVGLHDLGPDREWALEGAPSPEAFASRIRTAQRALARALAARFLPEVDYSIKTGGRRGFDYERFWADWG